MGTWNWLDWILALVVVASVVAATMKGFIRELICLVSVLTGLVVAALGYERAALWFEDLARSHEVALGLGFLTLFLATLLVGALVSVAVKKLVQKSGLEWFDRFLGAVFGLIRGVIINCILLLILLTFALKPQAVRSSALAPYMATGARVIALAMPDEVKAQFRVGLEKFHEALVQTDSKAAKN